MGAGRKVDTVTILDDGYKFIWTEEELEEIKTLWEEGYLPTQIATAMKEGVEDVFLVLTHLFFKGKIDFRREWT